MRDVVDPDQSRAAVEAEDANGFERSSTAKLVAQQAAVAQIGRDALAQRSIAELLDEACAVVGRVLETELVEVLQRAADGQSLKVVAGVGWRPGIVGSIVAGGSTGSQSGYTISSGGPVIVGDLEREDRFAVPAMLTDHDARSGMSVRIGDGPEPYGVLAAFTARIGRFSRDDANFLQAIANILAAAIDRFRVEAELRASRNELSAIVSGIDEGITVQGRDDRLLYANDTAARLSGYDTGQAMLDAPVSELASRFELIGEDGAPMGFDALPGRRAMNGEEPPPTVVGFRIRETGEQRWSLVSAVALRDADGAIRRVVNTFRDVTEERWASESQAFMADAVAVLSSTLDADEAGRRLANVTVPRLADYCVVHLLQADGSVAQVALVHADPSKVRSALRAQQLNPPRPDAPTGPARVIRDGTTELVEIVPGMIEASGATGELLDVLNRLELRWYICVPLMGRHGPIGALTLVTAESGRVLGERELALARELGERAGIALENAQLFQTADDRRAQLDTVLAALAESVLVFDASGGLRLANKSADRTFGGQMPASIDTLWERLGLDPEKAPAGRDGSDELLGTEVSPDGGRRWFELHRYRAARQPVHGGLTVGPTVVVLRDVTQARAARAARDAFMGVLSHELRTPITTIYGGSELLERGLDEAGRREVIADIRGESERLARLVEDLLVMTRVERGMVEIADEPILLQHLIASVIAAISARSSDAPIALRVTERLPAVRGDTTYIEQVVRNLLTNAVRYGRGSEDGVEVAIAEDDGQVAVRVLDRGPGFGGEDPERLFDLFFRTASARSVPGGAGIGLFVCRHLIEAMGGRIWALERPDGGAEFGFALPVMDTDVPA